MYVLEISLRVFTKRNVRLDATNAAEVETLKKQTTNKRTLTQPHGMRLLSRRQHLQCLRDYWQRWTANPLVSNIYN